MYTLRPYQQEAVDSAISWMSKCLDPAVMELATGAGKSIIAATLAAWLNTKTHKKILVLQPSKELTEQNREKYLALGEPCSVWCASIGKSIQHDVVFGTPKSVINSIDKFVGNFSAVIIDEAHRCDETTKNIVYSLKEGYKNLRVLGITATPYRLDTGYIFRYFDDKPVKETVNPFFHSLIHQITARDLIDQGFLTPPTTEEHAGYTVEGVINNQTELDRAVEGQGRKTSRIIQDVVERSASRQGVIIFAASVKHVNEIMESLPPTLSECITGSTSKKEREQIIKRFKQKRFKYLVNCGVLTTGFDAPHVDVVAILRATSSVSLLQQIIGRGLRLCEGKNDALILDYAENIEKHCPDGDVFNPTITAPKVGGSGECVSALCPDCGFENEFTARENPERLDSNEFGYFVDLEGNQLEMPSHYGRRCEGQKIVNGTHERCAYRWTSKECPECGNHNDIAARVCDECGTEIVDPNEKLKIEFAKIKKDPYSRTTDKVLSWSIVEHCSQAGNITLKATYKTEYRTFQVWYLPKKERLWNDLCIAVFGKIAPTVEKFIGAYNAGYGKQPETVTVQKSNSSNFFNVYAHNRPEDIEP